VLKVYVLADAADERYRALVLLVAFTSLSWGELASLRRSDIDIQARTVRVFWQLNERRGGGFVFSPPKSEAGHRIVAIPELITPDLAAHIVTHARWGDDGLVFTRPSSEVLAARCRAGYPSGGIGGRAGLAGFRPLPSLRPDSQASIAAGGPVTSTGGLVPMRSMP
jgi:integrase